MNILLVFIAICGFFIFMKYSIAVPENNKIAQKMNKYIIWFNFFIAIAAIIALIARNV